MSAQISEREVDFALAIDLIEGYVALHPQHAEPLIKAAARILEGAPVPRVLECEDAAEADRLFLADLVVLGSDFE